MARAETGRKFLAVTPSNSDALAKGTADAFYIGGAGNIVLKGEDGDDVSFVVQSGQLLQCGALYVMATGTDATDIVAVYL